MYENESGGDPARFDPEIVDCSALDKIASGKMFLDDGVGCWFAFLIVQSLCSIYESPQLSDASDPFQKKLLLG